jgi:flagellar biogenesis protein FliO
MQDLASFLEVIKNLIGLIAALVFLAGVTWLVVKVIGGRQGKKPSIKGQSEGGVVAAASDILREKRRSAGR